MSVSWAEESMVMLMLMKAVAKAGRLWVKATDIAEQFGMSRFSLMYYLDHQVMMGRLFSEDVKLPKGERRTGRNKDNQYFINGTGLKWIKAQEAKGGQA